MSGKALSKYYDILDGDRRANYLDTGSHSVSVDILSADSKLWDVHDAEIKRRCDNSPGRTGISLLDLKIELANRILTECCLCERKCGANRASGKKGSCGVQNSRISNEFIHMGEEPDLIPSYTVFFSGCTFSCVFCQNWDISTRPDIGQEVNPLDLAQRIERITGTEKIGQPLTRIRNVNWVGGEPTSNLPFILEVLGSCHANVPQVWNSNMYLSVEAMKLLDGIVDVYLTDWKYGNDRCALRLSNVPIYIEVMKRNHCIAREQAEMIIRHLVLPGHIDCCTRPALTWIAENLKDVLVNVMAQYRPEHRAREFEDIARPLRIAEYNEAIEIAETLGLCLCD